MQISHWKENKKTNQNNEIQFLVDFYYFGKERICWVFQCTRNAHGYNISKQRENWKRDSILIGWFLEE